jgi:hypothetical protein
MVAISPAREELMVRLGPILVPLYYWAGNVSGVETGLVTWRRSDGSYTAVSSSRMIDHAHTLRVIRLEPIWRRDFNHGHGIPTTFLH